MTGKQIVKAGSGVTRFGKIVYDGSGEGFDEESHEAFSRMVKAHNARWEASGRTHFGFATVDAVKWATAQLKDVDPKSIKMDSHSKAELARKILRQYDFAQAAIRRGDYDSAMGFAFETGRLWAVTCWKFSIEGQASKAARKAHAADVKLTDELAAAYAALPTTMSVKEKHIELAGTAAFADFELTTDKVRDRLKRHRKREQENGGVARRAP